jgi:hypothetical protein
MRSPRPRELPQPLTPSITVNLGLTLQAVDSFKEIARQVFYEEQAARDASPWRDLQGAAAYLHRTPEAVRKLRDRGKLIGYQNGRGARLYFHVDDLDAFIRGAQPSRRVGLDGESAK